MTHLGLVVARMHGILVTRPGSDVFHVYSGPLTPSGRFVPRAARTACSARTRQLTVLERDGSVLDLAGRRVCGRCSARLYRSAARPEQPIQRDACVAFYAGLTLGDLVVAVALATTVDETHRIGFAMGLRFPPPPVRRPTAAATDRARFMQALYDVHAELLRRRAQLRAAERTPEEVEAAAARRYADVEQTRRIAAARRQADALDRAIDRRNRGAYLMPHERDLLSSA